MFYDLAMGSSKSKLTATDWLDTALQVLAEDGVAAVAVEPLAKRLGVTKGSFYWHFANRNVLITELLKYWENLELSYEAAIKEDNDDPLEALRDALMILIKDDTNKRVFLALASSPDNKEVQKYYKRAVARRLNFLRNVYQRSDLKKNKVEERTFITYCAYFGLIRSLTDGTVDLTVGRTQSQLIDALVESAT